MFVGQSELGILPRSLLLLFNQLDSKVSIGGFEYQVSCQIMQVYNDKIYDCISDKRRETPLVMREDRLGNTFIKVRVNIAYRNRTSL